MKHKIFLAPLQGFTDHIWRNAHKSVFNDIDCYFSSFLRVEHGDIRRKDIRDITPENNKGITLVPQMLACAPNDAAIIVQKIADLGYTNIDINLGCPFPLIARKPKGAGMLSYPEKVEELFMALSKFEGIKYSVKMRLGMNTTDEWKTLLPLFDIISPSHITVHPRIGTQQYKGDLYTDSFAEFHDECKYPLVFNGDIVSIAQSEEISSKYPDLHAIMIGRGLLQNPAMLSDANNMDKVHKFHKLLYDGNCAYLEGGDHQILAKMKTYWEYLLPNAERSLRKKIIKSTSLQRYNSAVEDLFAKL